MKIKVRDKSGDDFEVENVEEVKTVEAPAKEELSADDILALKKLAEKAKAILALLDTEEDDAEVEEEKDEDEELDAEETDIEGILAQKEKEEKEEIVKDSKKVTDSQASFGSIENQISGNDADSHESEINSAWDKFYASQL